MKQRCIGPVYYEVSYNENSGYNEKNSSQEQIPVIDINVWKSSVTESTG